MEAVIVLSNRTKTRKKGKRKDLIITINTRMRKILYESWTKRVCIRDNGIYKCNYKWGIFYDVGARLARKRRREKKGRPRAKVRGSRTSAGGPFEYCL